jgi:hypothetical protein
MWSSSELGSSRRYLSLLPMPVLLVAMNRNDERRSLARANALGGGVALSIRDGTAAASALTAPLPALLQASCQVRRVP